VQSIQINNCSYKNRREEENSSSYKSYKLFLSEDWFEVVRVDYGIVSILLFRVDILLSSKSIWFGAKITRIEPNDKVELRKVLGPQCLLPDQHLSSRKILKVFIV